MKQSHKFLRFELSALCIGIALVMTGCGGGGSFDVGAVATPTVSGGNSTTTTTTTTTPTYSDDTSDGRRTVSADSSSEPATGYVAEIPRLDNIHPLTPDATAVKNVENVQAINLALNDIPRIWEDKITDEEKYNDEGVQYSHDGKTAYHTRNLDYVRSGYVIGERTTKFYRDDNDVRIQEPAGQIGYVFYQGVKPATALPNATATYQGTWDFTSNANKSRSELPEGFTADNIETDTKPVGSVTGATTLQANINRGGSRSPKTDKDGNAFGVGQTSEFTVNFSDKTLKGSLKSNSYVATANSTQTVKERYTIDGKLNGNRFTGTATAKDSDHAIFGQNSSSVEGGFYGDNAEELGGKFLADDKSLFAVFAGKREVTANDSEKKFDAIAISQDDYQEKAMDTFGNVAFLVLNGKQIPLLPTGKTSFAEMDFNHFFNHTQGDKTYAINVCCNNLDYVKFGSYATTDGTTNSDGHYYLIGERTATSAIPNSGTAHYRGTWAGAITSKDNRGWSTSASNSESGSRSRFDADFGKKTFTGSLIANNGTEDSPTLTMSGTISGNGFEGTAKTKTGGFNIDNGNTAGGALVNIDAKVKGGFYGPTASEIGGTVIANEDGKDKINAVFGGKKQVKK